MASALPLPSVLILGATGMLGNAVLRVFAADPGLRAYGTIRSAGGASRLQADLQDRLIPYVDVENTDSLLEAFGRVRPSVVINCVGLVKQLSSANDPLSALPLNAILPHRLSRLCAATGARLIHVSTDCVFSGEKGMYTESDPSDAKDLYGRSKYLGEVDAPHAITLRTSIIGHELSGAHGLVDWFLSQTAGVKGYQRAIFSGLPTVELAHVMHAHVLPRPDLHGVYQVAAAPINKFDLLTLVAHAYGKDTPIAPDDRLRIDRSLDGTRFRAATGYVAPDWPTLVRRMRDFH